MNKMYLPYLFSGGFLIDFVVFGRVCRSCHNLRKTESLGLTNFLKELYSKSKFESVAWFLPPAERMIPLLLVWPA